MLIGRYYHKLEAKGRLSLPKSFRSTTTDWVVTRGLDGALFLFPAAEFATEVQKLQKRTFTRKDNRDFIRLLTNEAQLVSVDTHGRVLLPEYLITFARLQKEVVIVGSQQYVEIWDRTNYHQYMDALEKQAEQITERVGNEDERSK